jgi:beta-1,4-mannosyltransferase
LKNKLTVGFLPWWPQNPYQILLKRQLNSAGVRVIGNPPLSLLRLLIGRDGLDVVHVHWPHGLYLNRAWRYPYIVLVLLLYRLLKNNIVWTVHELEAYESPHVRMDEWLRRRLMAWSRALIVHGKSTERELRERYAYRGPVCIARHPCFAGCYDDCVNRAGARARLELPVHGTVFLYFGYIKPYKGVEDLIAAFRAIGDPTASLVIAGRPLDKEIEHEIAALAALDPRIRCAMRYIPDTDVQLYFRASDVVVFPFQRTQTSGSVMLALTFGKPVIAPAAGTIPEYVSTKMGELFDPADAGSLRSAMCRVLSRDLQEMGRAAFESCAQLNWSDFAKVHLSAYRIAYPALGLATP